MPNRYIFQGFHDRRNRIPLCSITVAKPLLVGEKISISVHQKRIGKRDSIGQIGIYWTNWYLLDRYQFERAVTY